MEWTKADTEGNEKMDQSEHLNNKIGESQLSPVALRFLLSHITFHVSLITCDSSPFTLHSLPSFFTSNLSLFTYCWSITTTHQLTTHSLLPLYLYLYLHLLFLSTYTYSSTFFLTLCYVESFLISPISTYYVKSRSLPYNHFWQQLFASTCQSPWIIGISFVLWLK